MEGFSAREIHSHRMKRSRVLALTAAATGAPLGALAQGAAPYKIGVTFPLTGPLAPGGREILKGGEVAVADINRAGGIKGRPLQFVVEDTAGTPQGGVAAMRKVTQFDNVQAVLTIYTNVVTSQIPLADELKVPAMSTVEAPALFTKSEYSFSHAPTWDKVLPLMKAAWKARGFKRVAGLLTNSGLGQLQSQPLRTAAQEIGAEYTEGLLDPSATDYRGVITRVRDTDPQAIVITGQGSGVEAIAVKQIRELGIGTPIWSFSQAYTNKSFRDAVGPYGEGMIMGGIYLDPNNPASNAFMRAYRAQENFLPGYPPGETYDIVKIFAYAIGKVGYNGEAIRGVIATLKGFPSVLGGAVTMGADHYTIFSNNRLWQVRRGKLIPFTA
jgi:branched-chain amino acid transport system substrate-binding protein